MLWGILFSKQLDSFVHTSHTSICGVDVVHIFGTINAEWNTATAIETKNKQDKGNDVGHRASLVLQLGLNLK